VHIPLGFRTHRKVALVAQDFRLVSK
jgi:hypothetical protein